MTRTWMDVNSSVLLYRHSGLIMQSIHPFPGEHDKPKEGGGGIEGRDKGGGKSTGGGRREGGKRDSQMAGEKRRLQTNPKTQPKRLLLGLRLICSLFFPDRVPRVEGNSKKFAILQNIFTIRKSTE